MINQINAFSASVLTDILRRALGDDKLVVSAVQAAQLSLRTAYTAKLFRLALTYGQALPAAPQTLIAKLPVGNPAMAESGIVFQPGTKEEWFYRCIAKTGCVTTPKYYFGVAERATGHATLLLEDLGELEATSQTAGMSAADATLALLEAAKLHAFWWNKNHAAELSELHELSNLNGGQGADALVDRLYAAAWPRFLQSSTFQISATVQAFGDSLLGRSEQIGALCNSSPKTLLHGDFRVDNMLFDQRAGKRECYVLDWESVGFGCGSADVAWLIAGCVPGIDVNQESELLKHYHAALLAHGVVGYAFEQCVLDYRRSMVESFVQGVLSGTIDDKAAATTDELAFAQAVGERFVAAAERLALHEVL